jgi:hypothetical protein
MNDLGPVPLGLLGLLWADGGGMGRLPPQPPANLGEAAESISEPEAPTGGKQIVVQCLLESAPVRRTPPNLGVLLSATLPRGRQWHANQTFNSFMRAVFGIGQKVQEK